MRRAVTRFLCLLVLAPFPMQSQEAGKASGQAPDTAAWLEDFEQLKHEMAVHYANLEWAITERGLNLRALSDQTVASLKEATTQAAARRVIETFLSAFGDGHLVVRWPSPQQNLSS